MPVWGKILIAAAVFAAVSGIGMTFYIAITVFRRVCVRTSADLWTRGNSEPGANADHDEMHELAEKWNAEHSSYIREVSIENDGLKLAGQYFDFGFDRCAVILAGRTEGCVYSSGFSEPYVQSGYNILVPDSRCHGLSEGKYLTMGYREHLDLLAWIKFAHDVLSNKEIVLHGVCVGAATSVFAVTSPDLPDYVTGLTVEGLYESFYDVLRQRIKSRGHKTFPVLQELWLICRIKLGVNYCRFSPANRIASVKLPILFIHSREDISSLPEGCQRLFDACGSTKKQLVWMDSGSHSHIRLRHREEYDEAVMEFLKTI
ncbi:MAG: alpha/beta hydrolase [Clostridiales bacterium]|nr:alpha/beta hydrolase [Clostridiales bacterium]